MYHNIVLYCIQTFIKRLSVGWTIQRRSQCARPQEKKKVLRKAKVEERLLARIRERVDGDSAFQREGPIEVKDRDWAIAVLVWGTRSSSLFDERSGRYMYVCMSVSLTYSIFLTIESQYKCPAYYTIVLSEISSDETLNFTAPDAITSWTFEGLSLSPVHGLGVVDPPVHLTTFKRFFADLSLPYSVIRKEEAIIPVVVHNYLSVCVQVGERVTCALYLLIIIRTFCSKETEASL